MRKFYSFIYFANLLIILHLALVGVGQTIRAANTAPLCEGAQRAPCAYVAGMQDTLSDVAARFGTTTGALLIANPTVPLLWLVPPGTRIWIPVSTPDRF